MLLKWDDFAPPHEGWLTVSHWENIIGISWVETTGATKYPKNHILYPLSVH